MRIYIASSWRNQHGVEMLTMLLRQEKHEVISWVENNYGEWHNHVTKEFNFDDWVNSDKSNQSFLFDVKGAMECDILIYYGPAGKDACAELGAAYGRGRYIIGLTAKGEDIGLMRKMMDVWCDRFSEVISVVQQYSLILKTQ